MTKSVMYPELYFAWLAKFLNRAQDLLLKPCAIAVNEQGTLLLVDNNAVLVAKLSNPVHVTRLTGGGAPSKAQKCDLRSTAFQSAQGIAFIAREVAVVCDCAANALRILHVNEDGSFQVHISKDKLPKFEIEKPFGVATLVRLDATEPDSGDPRAVVAVTEYDRSTLLILMIEQNARLASKPYSVTRAFRISLQVAASPGPLRPLRGVAGSCTRRTNITVLRNRRDASIAAGEGNAAAIAAAHAQFAEDSRTPSKVYVTRQGSGVISREEESNAKKPKPSTSRPRSDVVAMDIATVLAALSPGSTTVPTGVTAMQDGSKEISLRGTILAHLAVDENAGPVTVDANDVVFAAERHRIIKCIAATQGASPTATIEGEPYAGDSSDSAWWPGAQPKDGDATRCTFGDVAAIAAWPCGRTLFCLDGGGGVSPSLSKVGPLWGLAEWFRLWRTQAEFFGEKDPTMMDDPAYCARAPPKFDDENLRVLEETAQQLDEIDRSRREAVGLNHVHGPYMAMDTNSLRSHKRK